MSAIRGLDGYCLRLADGQRWRLIATDGTGPFVEKMARMMGLRACGPDDCARMIFIRGNYDSEASPSLDRATYPELRNYPEDGWSAFDAIYLRMWQHNDLPDIICELFDGDVRRNINYNNMSATDIWRVKESLFPVYNKVIGSGGIVMHAAMFELNGKGALIVAKSGTGKSTCYRRIEAPWQAISDEEALVVRAGDQYIMHPMPTWSDYAERGLDYVRDVQRYTPLSGIFFLEQAPVDEAIPMGKGKAAMNIYTSSEQMCYRYLIRMEKEQMTAFRNRLLDNAFGISRCVPSFTLRATLTGRFWDEMEKVLL